MSREGPLKSPREMDRGLRVWGQSWEGSPGRRKPDQRLEKQRTGGREADDSKGYLRGILDRIKLWDRVRAGGGKTKLWRDRQMAEMKTQRRRS